MLAVVSQRAIHLYDRTTLALLQTIDEGEYTESAAFSPDGARLACICGEGLIKLWDLKSGHLLKTLKDAKYFTSVAFNPNGTQLAGGNFDGKVQVWDANGDKLLFTLASFQASIYPLGFSSDGLRILSASVLDGTVRTWDAKTGQLLRAFPEDNGFFDIEFSPDGTHMATSNISGDVVRVWDVNSGRLLTSISSPRVFQFVFANNQTIVCRCQEGILAWDVSNSIQSTKMASYDPAIEQIAPSPDGKQLALGMRDGSVKILPMPNTSTPTPLPKTALGGFPFPVGTTWVYSRVQYDTVIGDPTQLITATNLITETVVRAEGIVLFQYFLYKQTASLVGAPSGWQDNSANFDREEWYHIDGKQIYSSPNGYPQSNLLLYDFPLVVGKSWCPDQPPPTYNPTCTAMGRHKVEKQTSYTTPFGTFDECYEISEDINSGGVTEWFCNGIGVVAHKYDHAGTRFGFEDTLIRFAKGSPTP